MFFPCIFRRSRYDRGERAPPPMDRDDRRHDDRRHDPRDDRRHERREMRRPDDDRQSDASYYNRMQRNRRPRGPDEEQKVRGRGDAAAQCGLLL